MPVTIGVFINPAWSGAGANTQSRFKRSAEYDAIGLAFYFPDRRDPA